MNFSTDSSPRFVQHLLNMTALAIFAIGIVMIFSTTSAALLDQELATSRNQALFKQLFFAAIGCGLALYLYRLGYSAFLQYTPALLMIFFFLLLLVFIPGIGKAVNGSYRWISIPFFSFQPSEFVKYVLMGFFISGVSAHRVEQLSFKQFTKLLIPIGVCCFLILIEPNNGTVAVIGITMMVLFFLTDIPMKYWLMPLIVFACFGAVFALQLPYVQRRFEVYLHPERDLRGIGHQPYQAKIASGSGRLFGKGPGGSWQKLSYLPEAKNDYIAAIFAEEFGFVGVSVLLGLYMLFALLGFTIAFQAKEPEGIFLATAVTFLICFQAFLNLAVVSGSLPSTGLNLPLFSQGGSSLIANLMGVGLLQSVAK